MKKHFLIIAATFGLIIEDKLQVDDTFGTSAVPNNLIKNRLHEAQVPHGNPCTLLVNTFIFSKFSAFGSVSFATLISKHPNKQTRSMSLIHE